MVITDPPYCPICKTYMWTTDISSKYRCHCVDEDDIKWYQEAMLSAIKRNRECFQKKEENLSD